MIKIDNLSFCYEGAKEYSLQNINLTVQRGEVVLLTGESGCGKTTLTRIINGLCPNFWSGEISGRYLLNGKNAFTMSLDELGIQIGNVFQDPRSQFFTTNTTDEIVMAMENRNYSVPLMQERLNEIRQLLGIGTLLDRSIFQLSSGEKQKIAIAAACAIHPSVVVLDEPSANLDAESIHQLAQLLEVMRSKGLTIVISEHRLHYLANLIDKMVVMEKGLIKKVYSADEARSLSQAEMIKMGLRLFALPSQDLHKVEVSKPSFMQLSNISFTRQKKNIIKNLSLELSVGKVVVITGENGAGKSTLCKIIAGILKEDSGSVALDGQRINKRRRIKNSFFVGQDADYQLYASNVSEEITLNLPRTPELDNAGKSILRKFNLLEYQNRHPVSLSGGQKQRVLLAAALMRERPLLLLDEPTSGLDGRHMRIIADILRQIANEGISVLLITHDIEFSQLVADEVAYMRNGELELN